MLTADRDQNETSRPPILAGEGQRADRSEPAVVVETLPNKMLLVETRDGSRLAVHASGAMRIAIVRLMAGDAVRIEKSPFDATKGRITGIGSGHPGRVRSAPNETRRHIPKDPETAP
ncbi:MAG: translation initiation factor IF-1 [Planctomycetota bacterium]